MPLEALVRTSALTEVDFTLAAPAWLESRRLFLNPNTIKSYEERIRVMSKFFGGMRLTEIDGEILRKYQLMRKQRAGASCINHECSLIEQMLKRIGRWGDVGPDYQPLPTPKESPHRALTPQEEERLYIAGMSNPNFEVAYCAFVITVNTTCGGGEIRHTRLMDIDATAKTIRVQPGGAKNVHRVRLQPLNGPAWRAVEHLLERAQRLGSRLPEHYLIPFRIKKNLYDPTRPATSWRGAFREMVAVAGIKISYYSLRHHAITKLLEDEMVSEETVMSLAGHVSQRMLKRYSHVRIGVKRRAVERLEKIAPKGIKADYSQFKQAK